MNGGTNLEFAHFIHGREQGKGKLVVVVVVLVGASSSSSSSAFFIFVVPHFRQQNQRIFFFCDSMLFVITRRMKLVHHHLEGVFIVVKEPKGSFGKIVPRFDPFRLCVALRNVDRWKDIGSDGIQ